VVRWPRLDYLRWFNTGHELPVGAQTRLWCGGESESYHSGEQLVRREAKASTPSPIQNTTSAEYLTVGRVTSSC